MKRTGGLLLAIAAVVALLVWALRDDEAPRGRRDGSRPTTAHGSAGTEPRDGARAGESAPDVGVPARTDPPPPASAETGVRVVGIAIDDTRRPVAGCEARIERDGVVAARAVTGADGAFALRAHRPDEPARRPTLVLDAGDGRGATRALWLHRTAGDEVDVGRVELAPVHTLDVRVVRAGEPVPGARVALTSPERLARAGADGHARFACVRAGERTVLAHADGSGRGRAEVEVPHEAPVVVALPDERVVTVTVLDASTGRPVADATVTAYEELRGQRGVLLSTWLPPVGIAPTDAQGRTEIRGLDETARLRLQAAAPGYPRGTGRGWDARLGPDDREVRIELEPARAARWPVVDGERPVPPDGAAIAVVPLVGMLLDDDALAGAAGRMEGTTLVVEGLPAGSLGLLAVAPDGAVARLFVGAGEDTGTEVSFRAPRTVDVLVRERGGGPAEGVFVSLHNQGNNPLGAPVASDAEGRVRFEGLHGGRWDVYAGGDGSWWSGRRVGTVAIDDGSATIAVEVEPVATWRIHVTVDGEPRLPAGLSLTMDGMPVLADGEDPEAGVLMVTGRAPDAGVAPLFALSAPGFDQVSGRPDADGDVRLALRPGGRWTVDVLPPPSGRHRVQLERQAESGTWSVVPRYRQPRFTEDRLEFEGLEPGIYRLHDALSGRISAERAIGRGDMLDDRFDLRGVVIVRGRIVIPEGADITGARVDRTEVGERPPPFQRFTITEASRVHADGTWEARVPGDRPVWLHFRHPTLMPVEGASPLRVTGPPAEEPVIEFVPGAEAVFAVPALEMRGWIQMRALLYEGAVQGEPAARLTARLNTENRRGRIHGYRPGTYTLWLDIQGYVPHVLHDVELGEGVTDLGALDLARGSTLRVHLELPEGHDAPRVVLSADCRDEPRYARYAAQAIGTELEVRGLGAGTFEVRCRPMMGRTSPGDIPTRTITVDGVNDVELTFEVE